ncbi:unnamed protein product [[Candida] boidinii]|nr:unnamed protein product [[Candida] boidinii]
MTDDVKLDKSSMEDTESSSSDKSDSSIEYKAYMEYELLKKSIFAVEKWSNKANIVLQGRHQYRTRKKRNNSVIGMEDGEGTDSTNVGSANNEESEFSNNSAGSSVSTIEEIDALVKEIYELPLFVPEMEQFIEFVKEIELFETDALITKLMAAIS